MKAYFNQAMEGKPTMLGYQVGISKSWFDPVLPQMQLNAHSTHSSWAFGVNVTKFPRNNESGIKNK